MRFYVFCDESVNKGSIFSNFYGGLIVNSNDSLEAGNILSAIAQELKTGEMKWSKVNDYNLNGYKKFMTALFGLIGNGYIRIRVMFCENRHKIRALTDYHKEHEYHLLYYQFVKHAFGFKHVAGTESVSLEFFFDDIPDKREKTKKFKGLFMAFSFYRNLQNQKLNGQCATLTKSILKTIFYFKRSMWCWEPCRLD